MEKLAGPINGKPSDREFRNPDLDEDLQRSGPRTDGVPLAPEPDRSNVRSVSNVYVRDVRRPAHQDIAFRSHVRGRPALAYLLRSIYMGDSRKISELARQAEAAGYLSPEQAADAQGLRHYCGRKDFKCVKLPDGRHGLLYITCRCQSEAAQF